MSPPLPELSVVIATYNRAPLLARLVRQLGHQTLAPETYEVVIVDDGSLEPVAPWLEALRLRLALRLERQQNAGAAAARHRGILAARGRVVVITDDDMQVGRDFLEAHLARHGDGRPRLVLGAIAADPDAHPTLFERWHQGLLDRLYERLASGQEAPRGLRLFTGNASFPRADYLRVGGFDRALGRSEDAELGIRLEKAGLKVVFAPEAAVLNATDHASVQAWRKRNVLYGHFDHRIAIKHPDQPLADPWHFIPELNPISRTLVLGGALAPRWGAALGGAAYEAAAALDRLGLEQAAFAGVTLVYGLDYFRGLREELGGARALARDLARYARIRAGERLRGSRLAPFERGWRDFLVDRAAMRRHERRYGHPDARDGGLAHELVHRVGLQLMLGYRLMRALRGAGLVTPAKVVSRLLRHAYGSDIHWEAELAPGVMIVHGMGLAISHAARVGPGCILFQHVTLGQGAASDSGERGAPALEANVHVGPGATVLGRVSIGHDSKLAPNAVVTRSVPPLTVVEPAAVVLRARTPAHAEPLPEVLS